MAYTYSGLSALEKQAAQAQAQANHFESAFRHGDTRGSILYARQKYADLAKKLLAQDKSYTSNWINTGRAGALDALKAKYPNLASITAKLTPFDPQGAVDNLNSKRTLDQNLTNLTSQENQLNTQYDTSRQQFQQTVPNLNRQLLSNYASRGMGYSTGYSQALGQQQTDITNALANLDQQKAAALADITSQRGLANTAYQNDLASSLVNTTSRLSAKAGTLGFGPKGKDIYNDPTLLIKLAQQLLTKGG